MTPATHIVPPVTPSPHTGTSSRGRVHNMTQTMAESVDQRNFFETSKMHYMAHNATTAHNNDSQTVEDRQHDAHVDLQYYMNHPIAFHAEMMGDIMYLNQALCQPNADKFVEAVITEINGHVDNNHSKLTKRADIGKDIDVLASVWSMRCKRNITTNEIKKYKARLNLHGGKQEFGSNYYETYAPVVTWFSICLLIVIGIIFGWALRQCDFIMA